MLLQLKFNWNCIGSVSMPLAQRGSSMRASAQDPLPAVPRQFAPELRRAGQDVGGRPARAAPAVRHHHRSGSGGLRPQRRHVRLPGRLHRARHAQVPTVVRTPPDDAGREPAQRHQRNASRYSHQVTTHNTYCY